jgi:hypothetical protein
MSAVWWLFVGLCLAAWLLLLALEAVRSAELRNK